MIQIQATFPLSWPVGSQRTPAWRRNAGPNQMHGERVRQLLARELTMLRATNVVVSSNVAIRRDGLPYAGQRVDDPGVVLYFDRNGDEIAIACDRWKSVDANLRAIGLTVEAIRGIERWGSEEMVDRAIRGYKAIPENVIVTPYTGRPWHEVLEVQQTASPEVIRAAYKQQLLKTHPDHGGNQAKFEEVQRAYHEATK